MTSPRPSVAARLGRVLPTPALRLLGRLRGRAFRIPPGRVRWGDLRRVEPLSRSFGYDRGTPIDRYYIERFLAAHAADVRGRVLEVKDAGYTRRFGGARVTRSDVLDIDPGNPNATIVADLATGDGIPEGAFDCIILTQVLQLIYDCPAVVRTLERALRPGGVLLLTVPGITQIAYAALGPTWFWSFSEASVRRLLAEGMPGAAMSLGVHGNVFAAAAQLYGLAVEEVRPADLDPVDPDYQVILAARVVKAAGP